MTVSLPRNAALGGSLAVVAALALSACGAAPDNASTKTKDGKNAATATSAADFGGLDALAKAAKKEGTLHIIAVPRDWANYGAAIDGFQKKYGIKIEDESPDGTSQDEINAVTSRKGQDRAPDVLDLGSSFALSAAQQGLVAPYKVASYTDIPEGQKDPQARWFNDYGGYISIGCDAKRVKTCPTSFKDLLKPQYKGQVALNGNPTKSGSAFGGVYAAALANGGSFDNIQPGLDFFGKLKKNGNYTPVESTPATVEKGETPISIDWDYLNAGYADEFKSKGVDWKVSIPSDGQYAQYYSQAINKDAPHPAAARPLQRRGPEPVAQGLRPPGPDGRDGEGRHPRQDGRRQAAEGHRHAVLPDRGPAEQGQDGHRSGLGEGRLRMTAALPRADVAPVASAKRRRRAPGWLAVVPLLVFTAIAFGLPAVAILDGAFTVKDPTTGATSYTTENLTTSLQGPYLTALVGSVKLSAISAALGALLGLPLAQAVVSSRSRALREAVLTASGVLANFGGVPLAFAFVATLGNAGVLTVHLGLKDSGWDLYSFWGLVLVYLYFLIPLMVLTITSVSYTHL